MLKCALPHSHQHHLVEEEEASWEEDSLPGQGHNASRLPGPPWILLPRGSAV